MTGPLEGLVTAALDKRVLVLMGTVVFLCAGIWAFSNIKVDAVPDISNVQVSVTTTARGMAPTEVEQYITYPIEMSLQNLPRLSLQRSISKYALSQVTAVFEDGTNIYWARQQVAERLQDVQARMPDNDSVKIMLGPIATGLSEVYQFEVKGYGYSLMQLRDILDWQVIPELKTVAGVEEVQSMGGDAKEFQVLLNPQRLVGFQVTPYEVCSALEKGNAVSGGGYVVEASDQVLLRADGMLRNVHDIENLMIRRSLGRAICIKDVGCVRISKMLPQSIVTANGRGETVIGIVLMRKGENSKEFVERIEAKLNALKDRLPHNVWTEAYYNRGSLIDHTINTVRENLSFGALFVLFVLLFLLGSLRGGIITAISIPLALSGSLLFLKAASISGNLLSLGAIDFGILIDGSVVMVENVLRRLNESPQSDRLDQIKEAAKEVALPILAAISIITVVYIPILALPGVSGKTFQPMAMTVIFGLVTSLFISLFITPALCYFFLEKRVKENSSFFMAVLTRPYRFILLKTVRSPIKTSGFAFCIFLASLCLLPGLGSEFIPTLKEGSVVLTINRPASGSLGTAADQTTHIEQLLLKDPDVETVVSRTGHSEIAFDPMGPDETDVFINFKNRTCWAKGETQADIEARIDRMLKDNVPGLIMSMSQPIEQRMNELIAGAKSDVAIRIFGDDMDQIRKFGQQVGEIVGRVRGCSNLRYEQTFGLPVVTAKLNQLALATYGISPAEALTTVEAAVDGKVVGTIYEGKPRYPLTVRFSDDCVQNSSDIADLPVGTSSGNLIPLGQIAEVKRAETCSQIGHLQTNRNYLLQMNVRNRDLGGFVSEAQKRVERGVQLPSGYRIEWGGQFENMRIAQERLCLLIPLSLLMIFAILFGLYNDWRPGLLIFANIPLAFSGGVFALYARHMALSVTAGIGFIALFGVAVLNGVVLVSTIRQVQTSDNLHARQAAILGAKRRLRPVLMTALVASLGFVPMATASSIGAEVQKPLATVVIAGLVTSTFLTLLVLPCLYSQVCGGKRRKKAARIENAFAAPNK